MTVGGDPGLNMAGSMLLPGRERNAFANVEIVIPPRLELTLERA